MAKTDVACRAQTDVVGIRFRVEVAYQKTLTAQDDKALAAVLKEKKDQLAAAGDVISAR